MKYGGKDALVENTRWFIGKNKIVMSPASFSTRNSPKDRQEADYSLWGDQDDSAPAPNNINMVFQHVEVSPDGKQFAFTPQTYRGVFAWDGDRLKLCFRQLVFGKRPTEMPASSTKDDHLLMVVLERQTGVPQTDEEKLQGDWKIIGGEVDGEEIYTALGTDHLSFVGDLLISQGEEVVAFFKLDATKSPKQFTYILKSGNIERKVVGIYSLDVDGLKMCQAKDESSRIPGEFTAPKGSDQKMFILQRVNSPSIGEQPQTAPNQSKKNDLPAANPVIGPPTTPPGSLQAPVAADIARLQGIWSVVSVECAGKLEKFEETVFMVDGKRACIQSKDQDIEGGLYLDVTTTPKQFDFATSGWTRLGIYSLEGDTLKMCYELENGATDVTRPTRLATYAEGKQSILITLNRVHGAFSFRRADGSRTFPQIVERATTELEPAQPPRTIKPPPAKK